MLILPQGEDYQAFNEIGVHIATGGMTVHKQLFLLGANPTFESNIRYEVQCVEL